MAGFLFSFGERAVKHHLCVKSMQMSVSNNKKVQNMKDTGRGGDRGNSSRI